MRQKLGPTDSTAAESPHDPTGKSWAGRRFALRLMLGLIGAMVTLLATTQDAADDPYQPLTGAKWWLYPVEVNGPKRLAGIDSDLRAVAVRKLTATKNEVWIVGDSCLASRSADNGRTWEQVDVLDGLPTGRLGNGFPDSESRSDDYPLRPLHFYDIDFVGDLGWIVGDGGTILHTADSGQSWVRQHSDVSVILNAVSFSNTANGFAVGADNTILRTTDSGQTWEPVRFAGAAAARAAEYSGQRKFLMCRQQAGPPPDCFYCCATARDSGLACVGGHNGEIYLTSDGGDSWDQLVPPRTGRAAVRDLILIKDTAGTSESPDSPKQQNKGAKLPAFELIVVSELRVDRFDSQQNSWSTVYESESPDEFVESAALSTQNGQQQLSVALSISGSPAVIRLSVDGRMIVESQALTSSTWLAEIDAPELTGTAETAEPSPTPSGMMLQIDSSGTEWFAGADGLVAQSQNNGTTWAPTTRYFPRGPYTWNTTGRLSLTASLAGTASDLSPYPKYYSTPPDDTDYVGIDRWSNPRLVDYLRLPAPWFWLIFLPSYLYVVVREVRRDPDELIIRDSVEQVVASDRPINPGDPDPLGFGDIAAGLSRFIRNEKTEPPLTIALTGGWGSGKTSLMNLLKGNLEERGFQPVWFNAWHHQQECHMLASLLASVKAAGTPPLWRFPQWLTFRGRLLIRRTQPRLGFITALTLVFAIAFGYFWNHPGSLKATLSEGTEMVAGVLTEKKPESPTGAEAQKSSGSALIVLVGSALGLMLSLYRGIQAFGVQPGELLATVSGSMKIKDLTAQAGFRYQFAREFADVTESLRPRSLVILIDDLDRCQPKNVMQTLEMINFLVTSGKCIVVMGVAKKRVIHCIAGEFRDMVQESLPDSGTNPEELLRFATNYLEKIINVEMAVPTPDTAQARQLVGAPDESQASGSIVAPPNHASARSAVPRRKFQKLVQRYATVIVLMLTFILGLSAGSHLTDPQPTGKRESTNIAESVSKDELAEAAVPRSRPNADFSDPFKGATFPRATLAVGDHGPGWLSWTFPIGMTVLGLSLATFSLLQGSPVVYRDSPVFTRALSIWMGVITLTPFTPRSLKQFLNRVRFVAMRYSPDVTEPSYGDQFLRWIGRWFHSETPKDNEEPSPNFAHVEADSQRESVFVLLCAVHQLNPRYLTDTDCWAYIAGGCSGPRPQGMENIAALEDSIQKHMAEFSGAWPISKPDHDLFLSIMRDGT